MKSNYITVREASVQVSSVSTGSTRFVHAETVPATREDARPRLTVYRTGARMNIDPAEDIGVNLSMEVNDNRGKRGSTVAVLAREEALKLIKAMVTELEIAPHELAEL